MQLQKFIDNVNGRVAVPIIMWMLGAPLGLVVLLWFFFFRGR